MAGMLEYKCPCCDGAIKFDSTTQKLKCPYCDTEFEVDALKGYDEDLKDAKPSRMNWTTPGGGWAEGETAGLHTYACKSCGGEIVGDDTMAASACPFCGNPIVLTGQFAGDLRPDLIIPFKLDKKAAKEKLQEHLKGKTLLPKVFRSQNHIDEIKGVYVPFWLYDSDADAQLRFTATRTRCWSDDDYDYTETSYYSVRRDGVLGFDAVPVDGSSKMADDLMESIEPFAMQDAVAFNTAYLAGYVADKYDVDAKKSIDRKLDLRISHKIAVLLGVMRDVVHGATFIVREIKELGGKACVRFILHADMKVVSRKCLQDGAQVLIVLLCVFQFGHVRKSSQVFCGRVFTQTPAVFLLAVFRGAETSQ